MKIKPIIIVSGDPKSVFVEIFLKSLKSKRYKSPLIIICCLNNFKKQMKKFNFKKKIRILDLDTLKKIKLDNKKINLINIKLNRSPSAYINNCFELAFNLINKGFTKKLINGPINKKNFLKKKFYGVTEYIANRFNQKKFAMLIYNKSLSVCPVTTHLPLKLVPKKITRKLIVEKVNIINNFYKTHLKIKPKIAVAGLNPHCESILKYNEDDKIINFAVKSLKRKKINIQGPFPVDTLFLKDNRKKYNVILGMYHDQVLTPMKTLFEYNAINITMGLPFLRISPDHGPNKKMFGKNLSNPLSLIKALNFLDKK